MRVAYFGGDMFYDCMETLIKNGHQVIALFTEPLKEGEYDLTKNVRKQADARNMPIMRHKPTEIDIKMLADKKCDLILCAGYPYKIPEYSDCINYGVNIHPSLLPEGAGAMPMPFVIIKGLKKTGVTLHKLSQNWDAGDIVLQEEIPLSGSENLEELLLESQKIAIKLLECFLKTPKKYWDNASPQKRKAGDYWAMPKAGKIAVDYNQKITIVEKYLRAHRFIDSGGIIEFATNVSIWKQEHKYIPGTIILIEGKIYLVAAKDGLVSFKLEQIPSPAYTVDY